MSLKYELTGEVNDQGLRRIRALRDIPRYGVKAGDLGGWVKNEDNLNLGCWDGTADDLIELAHGDTWPSGGDAAYRDKYRPSLIALAEFVKAQVATWEPVEVER